MPPITIIDSSEPIIPEERPASMEALCEYAPERAGETRPRLPSSTRGGSDEEKTA